MTKRKSLIEQTHEFQKTTNELRSAGYEVIMKDIDIPDGSYMQQVESIVANQQVITAESDDKKGCGGRAASTGMVGVDFQLLEYSQNVGVKIVDKDNHELGRYIPWGRWNNLPNMIYRLSGDMPWTAQALQYLGDTASGLGPRLMYRIARYSGGTVTDELIPYENAGVWMQNRKRELIQAIISASPDGDIPAVVQAAREHTGEESYKTKLLQSYKDELQEVEKEYDLWQKSLPEIEQFHRDNNLDQHFQACMAEDVRMDIYFPTVGLSMGKSGSWNPKIVRIGKLDDCCTRFEERDEEWNINNVFYSERWREDFMTTRSNTTVVLSQDDVVPYPVVMPEHGFDAIREYVRKSQRTKVSDRKLWWACPQYHATTKAYYPQSAWWSIFPSQVFRYASTLIYDKAVAKKNSVMWGKILYVNTSFLNKVFEQMGIAGDEEQQKLYRNKLYDRVEEFLKRRSNNGKLLIMDSYMSADEKNLIDSIRIVDVPQASEKDSDSSLQIATSAVFFALGVHPALVGATPGATSTSGTFQRELHLLKVTQLSSRQRRYLSWLNGILRFNSWPRRAQYVIKQANLSTLDASKTGIVETHEE